MEFLAVARGVETGPEAQPAVAKRGSRLALYDLRESLKIDACRALDSWPRCRLAGDATCLVRLPLRMPTPGADNDWVARRFVGCVSCDRSARELTGRHAS